MKTAQHTPGPWYVKTEYANVKNQLDVCGDGLLIAECRDYAVSREMSEANAHLIAAAPDLLAALKKLLEWAPTEMHPNNPTPFQVDAQFARAAIAKATGGA